jgi:ubiquitin C-terminal hydrolase
MPSLSDDVEMTLDENDDENENENQEESENQVDTAQQDTVMCSPDEQAAPRGGLVNLGNTCYLNSALQLLASVDGLVQALVDAPLSSNRVYQELVTLLQQIQGGQTVAPSALKEAMDEASPLFVGYRQHDAHEFLTTLLDLLNDLYLNAAQKENQGKNNAEEEQTDEEIKIDEDQIEGEHDDEDENKEQVMEEESNTFEKTADITTPLSRLPSLSELRVDQISQLLHGDAAATNTATNHGLSTLTSHHNTENSKCKLVGGRATRETPPSRTDTTTTTSAAATVNTASLKSHDANPIQDYFATHVSCRLTCDSCRYTRTRTETYLHLSLDMMDASDALRQWLAPQVLSLKCEHCFGESATQTMEFTKLPKAWLLHWKRFVVQYSPVLEYTKSLTAVGVPLELDGLHRLKSLIYHHGASATCGHYTADVLEEGCWWNCNDALVRPSANTNRTMAYLALYELQQ